MDNSLTAIDHVRLLSVQPGELLPRLETWRLLRPLAAKPYCYIMWRMDLARPVPCYVGIGRGPRLTHHETKQSAWRCNPHKAAIIRRHHRRGIPLRYSIYSHSIPSWDDATAIEIALIALLGRRKPDRGPLCNLTAGGDGANGLPPELYTTRPVIVDDRHFNSVTTAAAALGLKVGTLHHRLTVGWPGLRYEDELERPISRPFLGRYRRSVIADGAVFPSLSEAKRQLNLDIAVITLRIRDGWAGYHFVDEGQRPYRERRQHSEWSRKQVVVDGVRFAKTEDAGKAHGISREGASKRCRSPNFPNWSFA